MHHKNIQKEFHPMNILCNKYRNDSNYSKIEIINNNNRNSIKNVFEYSFFILFISDEPSLEKNRKHDLLPFSFYSHI